MNGKEYWYARIGGVRKCFGSGAKGHKLAKKAREKFNVKEYENRELKAGLKVKRVKLANMVDMKKWYLNLPTVAEQKAYERKKYACNHLADYFNDRPLSIIDGDDIEHFRVYRRKAGVKNSTIDYELRILKNMYS